MGCRLVSHLWAPVKSEKAETFALEKRMMDLLKLRNTVHPFWVTETS